MVIVVAIFALTGIGIAAIWGPSIAALFERDSAPADPVPKPEPSRRSPDRGPTL
jgi:hypothetical protein